MKSSLLRSLNYQPQRLGANLIRTCLFYVVIVFTVICMTFFIIDSTVQDNYTQERNIVDIQENLTKLEKSLLDQETGQRGFILTGMDEFLEPFDRGTIDFLNTARELNVQSVGVPRYQGDIHHVITHAQDWRNQHGVPQVRDKMKGLTPTLAELEKGKAAFDQFRQAKSDLHEKLEHMHEIYRHEMLLNVTRILVAMTVFYFCGGVLLFLSLTKSIKKIVTPIIQLDECVSSIAAGDFTVSIPVAEEANELASLSSNIEYMRRELKEERDYTHTLFEFFMDIQQKLSPQEVYQKVGVEIASLLNSESLMIMGKNSDGEFVVKMKMLNGMSTFTEEPIDKEDSEVFQSLLKEQSMLYTDWNDQRPSGKQPDKLYQMGMKSSIHFLITHNGTCLGMVNVASKKERNFTAKTFNRMKRMGSLIGLALHNATAHENMKRQALRDGLTGVWNRRYFDQSMEEVIKRCNREKESNLSLLMIDVDHFKSFNDTYGHAEGDQMLIHVGRILSEYGRQGDIVARYGGEEFAIIMPETDMNQARQIADRLRRILLHDPYTSGYSVTASFGVSAFKTQDTPLAIIERADKALYTAKENGRNRVEIEVA